MHFLEIFGQKKCFFGSKTVFFFGQGIHYYMLGIANYTELNLQKRRICGGKKVNTLSTKVFMAIFALAERL